MYFSDGKLGAYERLMTQKPGFKVKYGWMAKIFCKNRKKICVRSGAEKYRLFRTIG